MIWSKQTTRGVSAAQAETLIVLLIALENEQ